MRTWIVILRKEETYACKKVMCMNVDAGKVKGISWWYAKERCQCQCLLVDTSENGVKADRCQK